MKSSRLQTLDRGLLALKAIADSSAGLSVAEVANVLHLDRAIAHRVVATLADHSMVVRAPDGRYRVGIGPVVLAARFDSNFRSMIQPVVERLAKRTNATAFVAVADGADCVAIASSQDDSNFLTVTYRPGRRHPIGIGASGIAILSGRPETPEDPDEVKKARACGYSVTRGQVQKGAVGVAAPLKLSAVLHPGLEASIGVVAMEDLDLERSISCVLEEAEHIGRLTAAS